MERLPLADLEPDFGVLEAWQSGDEQAWRAADKRRSEYRRDDTGEIPQKMLAPGKPIELDDIYAMLNVYYWWEGYAEDPADHLEDLLKDLTRTQVRQAVRALHAAFPEYCCRDYHNPKDPVCEKADGWKCFTKLVKEEGDTSLTKLSRARLAEAVLLFFDDFEDEEYDSVLAEGLKKYNYRKLGQAGLSDIECSFAAQVVEIEADRRHGRGETLYGPFCDHLQQGGTMASFLDKLAPHILAANEGYLKIITQDYEDIPDDWLTWDYTKKLALAKRYVQERKDSYGLYSVTSEWETYGVVPPYIYAMRPDGVFPGEI